MKRRRPKAIIFGLAVSSSWGNGHATTYRSLVSALRDEGWSVQFFERYQPWYAAHRDPEPPDGSWGKVTVYTGVPELRRHRTVLRTADLVIVGSYVPEGIRVLDWVLQGASGIVAFYDIDTPVTLGHLARDDGAYLARRQVPLVDAYLSFAGGEALDRIRRYGARLARPLYCSADPAVYRRVPAEPEWAFGYLGTYSADRQEGLETLFLEAARGFPNSRFVVAGAQYPECIRWPANVHRINHVAPADHADFYSRQRFTVNVTRRPMREIGYSPSVRLFEAAACGTPVISDTWPGLEEFFVVGREILVSRSPGDSVAILRETSEDLRREIGACARARVVREHTGRHRARELIEIYREALGMRHFAGRERHDEFGQRAARPLVP